MKKIFIPEKLKDLCDSIDMLDIFELLVILEYLKKRIKFHDEKGPL